MMRIKTPDECQVNPVSGKRPLVVMWRISGNLIEPQKSPFKVLSILHLKWVKKKLASYYYSFKTFLTLFLQNNSQKHTPCSFLLKFFSVEIY